METNEAGREAETAATDLNAILADGPSPSAPVTEQPQTEAAPVAEAPQAAPEAKPYAPQEQQHPFWYRKRLKEIEDRAKAAERRAQELEQRHDQPQPQAFESPAQYFEHMRIVDRLERSEDRFVDKHGEQEFDAVKEWLATRPDIEAWAQQQRHPWGAAHQQYQREKLSAEIGDDPNAWREKERERLRAEILAEMPSAPMARPQPHIPAPASGARSAAPRNAAGQFTGPTPLTDIIGQR